MILSVRHKFVFVKGYKVAGTSIEMALSPLCGPEDIVTPLLPVDEVQRLHGGGSCRNYGAPPALEKGYLEMLAASPPDALPTLRPPAGVFYNHMPLTAIAARYEGGLKDFRILAAERSPYEKVISWLNMQLSLKAYERGGEMRGDPALLQRQFDVSKPNLTRVRNIERYRDGAGRVAVALLRYETLQQSFDALLHSLGERPAPLPHVKKGLLSATLDPRAVFRPDQLAAIHEIFAEEFDTFGYPRF